SRGGRLSRFSRAGRPSRCGGASCGSRVSCGAVGWTGTPARRVGWKVLRSPAAAAALNDGVSQLSAGRRVVVGGRMLSSGLGSSAGGVAAVSAGAGFGFSTGALTVGGAGGSGTGAGAGAASVVSAAGFGSGSGAGSGAKGFLYSDSAVTTWTVVGL